MTDKNQIKQYLQDRLQGLEDIKKDREWTTAELGDVACCKQTLAFINSLQEEPVSNDFEEEYDNYTKHILACDVQFKPFTHLHNCAKYFFELGLKAQKGG